LHAAPYEGVRSRRTRLAGVMSVPPCPGRTPSVIARCTKLSRPSSLDSVSTCVNLVNQQNHWERKSHKSQRLCPRCSCDAASVLSFVTDDGGFAAAVRCHVCSFGQLTDLGFEDEQTARAAATHGWFEGTDPLTPRT
jgi:hypothetical protein